ncbi:DarT ssDNA thymidine ADP-ribosyltransferase family protein [Aureimonas mangrovi]|uniref:DarT ssDNA thymidine ADP-ribosyltransferase family protein n=1 Tax=Aureimonas mangrovi TaxID=2758041 RepID=UPI00163DC56C|nr:DarT ssDNA thymidine ADP-ribosyltransferase family protein [Aureimonas mangrovi]
MEILAYQAFIAISLVVTRLAAPTHLALVAVVWTGFTVFNLFWPPLVILQLVVIWGTYSALAPPEKSGSEARKTSSNKLKRSSSEHSEIRSLATPLAERQGLDPKKEPPVESVVFETGGIRIKTASQSTVLKSSAKSNLYDDWLPKASQLGSKSGIMFVSYAREIEQLVHFTRFENLRSIMEHGLLPVSQIENWSIQAIRNDLQRIDGRDGISVSISHPNHRMFYKYREAQKGSEWVVLLLSPSLLWTKSCAFFPRNAADHRMRLLNIDDLQSLTAFEAMFSSIEGLPSRDEQNLHSCDPTDPQAEVMFLEPISPEYINKVVFPDTNGYFMAGYVEDEKTEIGHPRKGVFAARSYVREAKS